MKMHEIQSFKNLVKRKNNLCGIIMYTVFNNGKKKVKKSGKKYLFFLVSKVNACCYYGTQKSN